MARLTCTKAKLFKLCQEIGYQPPKKAVYTKAHRARTWWLEWVEDGDFYKIIFSCAAGRAYLACEKSWYDDNCDMQHTWCCNNVTMEQLNRLGLIEEEGK